jgi:hypothetical protein
MFDDNPKLNTAPEGRRPLPLRRQGPAKTPRSATRRSLV